MLSRPFSARERNFLFVLLLLLMVGAVIARNHQPATAPDVAVASVTHVAYGANGISESEAREIAQAIERRFEGFRRFIKWPDRRFPEAVKTVHSPDSDSHARHWTAWVDAEKTTLQLSRDWDQVFHRILDARSAGRALIEPRHWATDGFAAWWSEHGERVAPSLNSGVEHRILLALYASERVAPTAQALRNWDRTMLRLGEGVATDYAYSAWRVLQEHRGHDALMAFAGMEFSRDSFGDVRDWWADWRFPLPARFEAATGWKWEAFVDAWATRLKMLRETSTYQQALARLPHATFAFVADLDDEGFSRVRFRLELARSHETVDSCVAGSVHVPAYRALRIEDGMRQEDVSTPSVGLVIEHKLLDGYGSGSTVYGVLDCVVSLESTRDRPVIRFGPHRVSVP